MRMLMPTLPPRPRSWRVLVVHAHYGRVTSEPMRCRAYARWRAVSRVAHLLPVRALSPSDPARRRAAGDGGGRPRGRPALLHGDAAPRRHARAVGHERVGAGAVVDVRRRRRTAARARGYASLRSVPGR